LRTLGKANRVTENLAVCAEAVVKEKQQRQGCPESA